jgi:hypothetical protein
MKREHKINLGLALLVLAVIFITLSNSTMAWIAGTIFSIVILAQVIGLSVYKLALWFRYRNDPVEREKIVYSSRIYPEKVRRFLMDEKRDKDKI